MTKHDCDDRKAKATITKTASINISSASRIPSPSKKETLGFTTEQEERIRAIFKEERMKILKALAEKRKKNGHEHRHCNHKPIKKKKSFLDF